MHEPDSDSTRTAQSAETAASRRRFLRLVGAAGAATALSASASVAAAGETATVDDELALDGDDLQEAIVVFESNDDVDRLGELDLERGYYGYEALPLGYAELTGDQVAEVAAWEEVRYVAANRELEYFNDESRENANADDVQAGEGLETAYTGENVHAAVIDTGVDGAHPDLEENLAANWQWAGDPLDDPDDVRWEDVGLVNSDDNGHGTHCCGTVAGDGTESDGEYRGMAPDATITAYSANLSLTLVTVTSAFDHLIDRKRRGETEIQVVSNSYGLAEEEDYDPWRPGNVATWYSLEANVLPVFAAGNDGPDANTLNYYARAPQVLAAAATHADRSITDFSSRGRPRGFDGETNYDRGTAYENVVDLYSGVPEDEIDGPMGVYRNGVAAKGASVMSTLNPTHALQAYAVDDETWYGLLSGTSMACPGVAGVATLVVDAYYEQHGEYPDSVDVLNTLEAAADGDAVADLDDPEGTGEYTAANAGAGHVDALAAGERAEAGDLAGFDDVELADE